MGDYYMLVFTGALHRLGAHTLGMRYWSSIERSWVQEVEA